MCGRYTNTGGLDQVGAALAPLGVKLTDAVVDGVDRFNIAPTQQILAVTEREGDRRAAMLRWGVGAVGRAGGEASSSGHQREGRDADRESDVQLAGREELAPVLDSGRRMV